MGHVLERRNFIFYRFMIGEHEERERLEEAGVDGRVILN